MTTLFAPDDALPPPSRYLAFRRQKGLPVPVQWRTRSRADLRARGMSSRAITAAVRSGMLVRARENVYLVPLSEQTCIDACAVGGRLACVSELARWGVFVLDSSRVHVQVARTRSRLRVGGVPVEVHWSPNPEARETGDASVSVREALVSAVMCQAERAAIATIDSAWHMGLIDEQDIAEIFRSLPRRYRRLRHRLDQRAESGPESLVRLMLDGLPCHVEVQPEIRGVGRVDFIVDGWLIIECDSEAHHGGWEQRRRDLRRDQAAAALGYTTYRPIAEDIMWHPDRVLAALRGHLAARR